MFEIDLDITGRGNAPYRPVSSILLADASFPLFPCRLAAVSVREPSRGKSSQCVASMRRNYGAIVLSNPTVVLGGHDARLKTHSMLFAHQYFHSSLRCGKI